MFQNTKIWIKLSIGFGVMLLLVMGFIWSSVNQLEKISSSFEDMVGGSYHIINVSTDVANLANEKATIIFTEILNKDPRAVKEGAAQLDAIHVKVKSLLAEIDRHTSGSDATPEERQLFEDIISEMNKYNGLRLKVVSEALNGNIEGATVLAKTEAVPALGLYIKSIEKLIKVQQNQMTDSVKAAGFAYLESRKNSIILGLAIVIIGLISAFLITVSIARQLGGEPAYVSNVVDKISSGDLTVKLDIKSNDNSSLLYSIGQMVEKLKSVIGEVRSAADSLSGAAEEVSATAQSMSQSSSEQAASVEETSSSVQDITASIAKNSENARMTNEMAQRAAHEAREGGAAVSETSAAMKKIAARISVVDEIAYQTNLLALNAAIEAARAGEHGKGFAVVAAEVRKLAERSQTAAQEIGELATSSVAMADKAGKLLDAIVPGINQTSELVQEITAASVEQRNNVSLINSSVLALNTTTQSTASASEELAATSEELSAQAEQLQKTMAYFRMEGLDSVSARPSSSRTSASLSRHDSIARSGSVREPNDRDFVRF